MNDHGRVHRQHEYDDDHAHHLLMFPLIHDYVDQMSKSFTPCMKPSLDC